MTPHFFGGFNLVFQPPENWDRSKGECLPLPVQVMDDGILSVWKPDAAELAKLNAGGGVVIHLAVARQPVMSMGTCGPDSLLVSA